MDQHLEQTIESGTNVVLYIEEELSVCFVSVEAPHIGYLQFNFNPDFPQDAVQMYDAFTEVRSIIQEDK